MPGTDPISIRTKMVSTSPLCMHNVQTADPDNEWARRISRITAKRTKTAEDRREIARLEFLAGLYLHEGTVVVPKANIKRCFQEAAKATRKGKDIVRGLNNPDPHVSYTELAFDGQGIDPDKLWESGKYHDITIVAVRGRTPRCRPLFQHWGLVTDWLLIPTLLDYDEFTEIVRMAGIIEGLGDNRVNGYGRFTVEVSRL